MIRVFSLVANANGSVRPNGAALAPAYEQSFDTAMDPNDFTFTDNVGGGAMSVSPNGQYLLLPGYRRGTDTLAKVNADGTLPGGGGTFYASALVPAAEFASLQYRPPMTTN